MEFCPWEPAKYLIFSSNVPQLLFYSHFPAMISCFALGLLVLLNDKRSNLGKLMMAMFVSFGGWVFFDLILWATNRSDVTIFFWTMQILLEVLIFVFALYFVYVYLKNKFPSFWVNLGVFLVLAPFLIFNTTKYSLMGVDLANCYAIENSIVIFYTYLVEISITLIIITLSLISYKKDIARRKEILNFFFGIAFFLSAFSFGNIFGSFSDNWVVAQYGLFGMPIFVAFLVWIIVRFKAFNVKLIATQALVWGLAILIGSQFFFIKVTLNYILTGITFVATVIFGQMLIKSVKREIKQKEKLAKLNVELEGLLRQRESLVHLVTHKVKGSFTHSKYIFAGMLDGMFGPLSPELKKAADMGMESDNNGVATVDLILNAANLQKGTVKYDMKPIDFKELVEKTFDEKKEQAEKKGLKITKEVTGDECKVNGDAFWLKEVVHNFIENAIRYTISGEVIVGLKRENDKIIYFVHDTGVGVTDEDKKNLFTEGGRGANSVKVNVDSTGYGLYTVKLVVEAHGGRVWVQSEGQGKGSTFFAELNAI